MRGPQGPAPLLCTAIAARLEAPPDAAGQRPAAAGKHPEEGRILTRPGETTGQDLILTSFVDEIFISSKSQKRASEVLEFFSPC